MYIVHAWLEVNIWIVLNRGVYRLFYPGARSCHIVGIGGIEMFQSGANEPFMFSFLPRAKQTRVWADSLLVGVFFPLHPIKIFFIRGKILKTYHSELNYGHI